MCSKMMSASNEDKRGRDGCDQEETVKLVVGCVVSICFGGVIYTLG